ncbi:MAG: carboxypeptidase regulatory-like domain-containing protein [Bryobacteraceae bacterium]|nr:carboxypeptidase regulatory-like domain-containing protein [Bryobacteraceae bacterium]MDW8379906.1 carboxypeptidase regulatory-like domain-containing protein [Bryobacterales bacterium]
MKSFLGILALSISLPWALAQSDRGVINGMVTDSSGAAVPEARVTATNVATNVAFSTTTTTSGDFTIPALPAGTYQLRIERAGFKTAIRNDVVLTAGGSVTVNAQLEVGAVTESVQVAATLDLLQTSTAKVSTAVTNKMIDELPLVVGGAMRGIFDLALITPEANQPSDDGFNVGGGQGGAYGATLDGVSVLTGRFNSVQWTNVNTPSVDAITEFAVETNGFKAEYGRAQGGMMTFTSKSGTNELHGTAYEFLRNDALDSRRFFEDRKGKYKQHDFGWSVGGPVYLPKIYNGKNRTFFFGAGEWFRNRVGASSGRFSIPTPEMFNGDFSNWVDNNNRFLPIYDPATTRPNPAGSGFIRTPFPGNLIPQSRFANLSRNYVNLVKDLLKPNNGATPGTSDYVRNNYINNVGTALDPWTKYSIKLDHNFGQNDRVSFLYNYALHDRVPGPEGFPGLPGILNVNRVDRQKSNVYRATYDKVITPTVVNHMFGGVNLMRDIHFASTLDGKWEQKGICLKGAWDCNRNLLIAEFSDYSTWVARAYDGSENFVFSFGDDMTITKGKHTIKAGYLWERIHYNGFGQQTIGGLVRGDRRSTSVPNDNNLSTGGGNGFASFLLGQGFSGGTENDRFIGQQWRSHAFYIQDDFKFTPRLTLNFGVRYEFTLPPLEQKDRWSDLDPLLPNARAEGLPGALRFAGFGPGRENRRALAEGWFGGIGPRFGLAYALNSKTVIRSNVGRSFGVAKTITGSAHFEGSTLVFTATSLDNGITPIFLYDEGLPPYRRPPVIDPTFSNGASPAFWDGEAVRLPENYQWTFSIQRQITNTMVLETNYNATIGAHLVAGLKRYNQLPFSMLERYGRDLLSSSIDSPAARAAGLRRPYQDINCQFSATCAPVSVAQALRPFPQFRDINTAAGQGDKSGHSSYHAWVIKVDKRYSGGLTMQGSYVLSKLLTDADGYNPDNATLDHYNRRLEKSIGEYDLTHNVKMSYIWELPFGRGKRWLTTGPASWVLGNWRIAGSHFYSSGYPLPLTNSVALGGILFNGRSAATISTYDGWIAKHQNPNWKGGDRFFQPPSFFGPQPIDRAGNVTRHNPKARQPWNLNENYSLAKSFPIRESIRVDFRWEMFNMLNRFRPAPGSTNVQDPNFGVVQAQLNEPRRMQFGLKLYF